MNHFRGEERVSEHIRRSFIKLFVVEEFGGLKAMEKHLKANIINVYDNFNFG